MGGRARVAEPVSSMRGAPRAMFRPPRHWLRFTNQGVPRAIRSRYAPGSGSVYDAHDHLPSGSPTLPRRGGGGTGPRDDESVSRWMVVMNKAY